METGRQNVAHIFLVLVGSHPCTTPASRNMEEAEPRESIPQAGAELLKQILEPEFTVSISEMRSHVSAIAVHSVRIDHEVKLLSILMQFVDKLQTVLVMYIVITGTVSDLQHHRLII